jgi:MFS family permease
MGIAQTARTYRTVLGNPSLRRVLAAFFLFNAEEYAIWIAITLFAYDAGGATTAGIVAIAQLVPAAIVAPLASVLGDRLRRDHALALGYLVQSAAALACGIALAIGPDVAVYLTAIVSACSITLTRPVHNAILPDLANTTSELTAANSVSSTAEGLGIMVGPLFTALMVATVGLAAVPVTFAVSMLLAAALTFRLQVHEMPDEPVGAEDEGLVAAAVEGARALRDDRPAAVVTVFGGAQFLIIGVLDILYAVLAIDVLGVGEEGAGILAAAVGIGGLFGAAATAVLVGRTRLATPIELAVGATAGATAALAGVQTLGGGVLFLVVAGAARSFFDVGARTLLQRSVRPDILSRVFGLQEALFMVGLAAGSAIAPVLVVAFGDQGAFVAAGVLLVGCGIVALPALRSLDRRAVLPDPATFAFLRELDIFRPVPQAALEQLVAAVYPIAAAPDEVIIREGEVGDRFYVVTSGELVVERAGERIAVQGRGGYVGEIALLRDVPRTATVRAAVATELLAIDRDDFLDAVTGSRRSSRALEAEMTRRLGELGRPMTGPGRPSPNRNDQG